MKAHEIKGNEEFFSHLIEILKEGGTWGWPAEGEYFILREGKYYGTTSGMKKVRKIISQEYYEKYFVLLENNS